MFECFKQTIRFGKVPTAGKFWVRGVPYVKIQPVRCGNVTYRIVRLDTGLLWGMSDDYLVEVVCP